MVNSNLVQLSNCPFFRAQSIESACDIKFARETYKQKCTEREIFEILGAK